MDRMRVSLFSILGDLEGKTVLDLFCGSGAFTLEAFSRGAVWADLVESDRAKVAVLQKNLAPVGANWKLHLLRVERFLQRFTGYWDLVFVDPPFRFERKFDLVRELFSKTLSNPHALVVLHLPSKEKWDRVSMGFSPIDTRYYGGSQLLFFQRE